MVFEVIDSGIGISPKNLPHIFDVFTDAHNTTARRYGGTGLGLAICKKIVEMMGGSIEVESKEGTGSTFRFTIIFGFKPELFGDMVSNQSVKAGIRRAVIAAGITALAHFVGGRQYGQSAHCRQDPGEIRLEGDSGQ